MVMGPGRGRTAADDITHVCGTVVCSIGVLFLYIFWNNDLIIWSAIGEIKRRTISAKTEVLL